MKRYRLKISAIGAVVILGAIVGLAFATRAFDDYYYGPICQRYGAETGMEYLSVTGGTRGNSLRCTFRLYNDDGSFRAMVDVPVSRVQGWPGSFLAGTLRWVVWPAVLLPAVWLVRKFADD